MEVVSKTCSTCKEELDASRFVKDKSRKDGLYPTCKSCKAVYFKAHHIRNRQKKIDTAATWYVNNKDRKAAYDSEYRSITRDRHNELNRIWYANNLEHARKLAIDSASRRRAKKYTNGVYLVTVKEVARILSNPCFYCSAVGTVELDHVVPIARGGTHSIGNLVAACRRCNASKGSKTITEWKKVAA